MTSLTRLTVRMVRLAVRLAWLTPQQARGAEYDMWRAKRGNGKKKYFPLTINGLAKSIYHSLSLRVTLYHSSGIVKIDFVPLRCQVDDNASAAETCNVEVKQKKYGSARIFKNNVVHLSVTCCRQETHATKGNETNDNYAAKQTDTDGHERRHRQHGCVPHVAGAGLRGGRRNDARA